MKNRLFSFFVVLFASCPMWAYSGTCGTNLTWTLQDRVLTISGQGEMYNYGSSYTAPWYSNRTNIDIVIIENGVTSIGKFAFNGCSGLSSVTIPNSVTSIGSRAFYGCSGLTSITIPNSITSIASTAFDGCSGLTSIVVESGNTLYDSRNDCNAIIEKASNSLFLGCMNTNIPNGVTSIGNSAFDGCSGLTSIALPSSVTSIEDYAFYGCSGLTSITIPNSVTSIGSEAFYGCSRLTSITIPNNVTSIGYSAFGGILLILYNGNATGSPWGAEFLNKYFEEPFVYEDESKMTLLSCFAIMQGQIFIPNSVTSIGDNAFSGCSGLTSITIPNSVTSIGDNAFSGCSGLTSITIPNSVTSIGSEAFYGCSGLTSITIPNSVTSIGNNAFQNCSELTTVTIPLNIDSIGTNVFNGCTNLSEIIWNSKKNINISSLSTSPFYDVRSQITSFVFGDSVEYIPNYLCYGMSNISSVVIPDHVISIGSCAFSDCSGLTSVNIPDSVIEIGGDAFSDCSGITSITIGNGVSIIGNYSFYNCNNLDFVYVEGETPANMGTNVFVKTGRGRTPPTIYVPCGSLETYQGAPGWYSYRSCIKNIPSPYTITITSQDANMGSTSVPRSLTICDTILTITATPKVGYHFVQWSDSVTDNPRAISFSQDTAFVAEFAQSFSGQCGDSLYWSYRDSTLSFSGSGDMYNYFVQTAPWTLFVDSIKNVELTSGMTSIGHYAFYGCSKLTSFTIPKNISTIYCTAFSYCYNLEAIVVDSGNAIYDSRENCNAIIQTSSNTLIVGCKNSIIPNTVTTIGNYAYYGHNGITTIVIPSSVTNIYQNAFSECTGTINVIWEAMQIGNYSSASYTPFYNIRSNISSFVFGDSISHIPNYLCYGMSRLTSITIPSNITSIGEYAFAYCNNLTSISFPNGITSVGDKAFYRCNNLTDIIWNANNNVTYSSSNSPFVDIRPQITSFIFGDSVRSIPDSLCYGMTNLSSITISESVTGIGQNTFAGCSSIDSIIWNARSCEDFSASPFNDARDSVVYFTLSDSVKHIPANLCNGMKRLKEFTIPASVESIGDNVFVGCDSLAKVDISNLSAWGSTDFILSSAEIYVNGAKPKKIEIPEGVTRVGAYTFRNCSQVTEVSLPSSVTEIGANAFAYGNRLQTITLDAALETIGDNAFANCPYIITINANMEFPPVINYNVFANCGSLNGIDCYVPQGSLALYKKTAVWQNFNLHEMETGLETIHMDKGNSDSRKVFQNGQLYILLPDGTWFDSTGRKVQ